MGAGCIDRARVYGGKLARGNNPKMSAVNRDRLALFYDGAVGPSLDHMQRKIGLAGLKLPFVAPALTVTP